ncbi:MAG: hypothetical protein B7X46_13045 [Thiomonas sp. 15-66-11]|jgi:hypothetical protein|nr:MAG: hypothetical protein B7X46_13045 [Thiomonas sp. 15-66-11]
MDIFRANSKSFDRDVVSALKLQKVGKSDDSVYEKIKAVATRKWVTHTTLGGTFADFFLLSDGRLAAYAVIDLYSVDVERAPWVDGSEKSMRADQFVVIFSSDESEDIVDELNDEADSRDPCSDEDYHAALRRIFADRVGIPTMC